MAPWRLWRSVPTVMGSSFGRTGPNKGERARKIHITHSIAWGTGRVTLFTCVCHIIRSLRGQVVERFAGELADHAGRKVTNSRSHTFIRGTFGRMAADENIPIPVVDLQGYQMVYDRPGVLWESSYVDADNRIKLPLAKNREFSLDS